MPKKPKLMKNRKYSGLTDAQIEFLLHGHNLLTQVKSPFENEADIEHAWKENREFLLSYQGQDWPGFDYGKRPWGWWQFDAPEPRRQVGTKERYPLRGIHNGKHIYNIDAEPDIIPLFESETEYLTRLNLWLEGEKDAYEKQQKDRKKAAEKRRNLSKTIIFDG